MADGLSDPPRLMLLLVERMICSRRIRPTSPLAWTTWRGGGDDSGSGSGLPSPARQSASSFTPPRSEISNPGYGISYGPLSDPFTRAPIFEQQTRHRILVPLIAYALGLRATTDGAAVPVAANTAYLALLYGLLRRSLPAGRAAMSVLLMATTLVVISSQTWLGYPDSVAISGS